MRAMGAAQEQGGLVTLPSLTPGHEGCVENTALMVASKKAIEATRSLPLLHDPVLFELVRGTGLDLGTPEVQRWQRAEQERLRAGAGRVQGSSSRPSIDGSQCVTAPDPAADMQAVMTLVLRCRYVDDEILSSIHQLRQRLAVGLGGSGGSVSACASSSSRTGGCRPPVQVVLLGAGLDTRPWRLALGRYVSWFEVDLPSMTSFKHSCMERAGMQAAAAPSDAGAQAAAAGEGHPAFPLLVGSWAALAADLSQPGWRQQLEASGWQPGAPTVWVIEGVIYYLPQQDADRLIQDVTSISQAAGLGAVILSCCTPAAIEAINLLKERVAQEAGAAAATAGAEPAPMHWWWELAFPRYDAHLGNDPCAVLRQAGWETAHAVSTKDLEVMYDAGRNTQLLPASIIEQAERSCGAPVRYMIATATLGL